MKIFNDDLQMRSDWTLAAVHRRRAAQERRRATSCIRRRNRRRCCIACCSPPPIRRCRARSILRHRHDRGRRQAARPRLHRYRARGRLTPKRHGRASTQPSSLPAEALKVTTGQARRAAHSLRLADRTRLGQGGRHALRPGRAGGGTGARRRLDRLPRCERLDPQDRRLCARCGSLQRLDLLACAQGRPSGADRRAAPAVARGVGACRISGRGGCQSERRR